MCRAEDAELPSVLNETSPRAKKLHRCSECYRTITIGETYLRVFGVWDERPATYKICQHCESVRAWLMVVCGGYIFGQVLEELVEHWEYEDFRSIPFGRLIVNMKLCWHDGKDLVPDPGYVRSMAKEMLQSQMEVAR